MTKARNNIVGAIAHEIRAKHNFDRVQVQGDRIRLERGMRDVVIYIDVGGTGLDVSVVYKRSFDLSDPNSFKGLFQILDQH